MIDVQRSARRRRSPVACASVVLSLLAPAAAWANNSNPHLRGGPGHPLPWRAPGATPQTAAAANAHLTYYGGRVVSNMQVVQVLWGAGSYLSQVTSTASPSIATFYGGVLNSAYVDWLTEYNTTVSGGTNQAIGRGSFAAQYTITPSTTATTVDDSKIQSELSAQIQAGHLPPPSHDAAGNNNTYYAVFFPHGVTITQGGSSSCVSGGFCAYHGTVASVPGYGEIYYGVHPDMQAGSGCDTGCGSASTAFGNYTSVASHEMVEAITDPEVGLATANAAPLAWYDPNNGEIGDICNAQQGSVTGGDGVTYVVQQEWSNAASACVVTRSTTPTSDFSLALSPTSLTVAAGSSGALTAKTAVTSGTAQTVTLTASPPAGLTATFSPTSVTAGGSSTLTVAAAASMAAGTYSFTVTGTGTSATHTTTATVTVTTTAPSSGIANGGFETGTLSGWTAGGAAASAVTGGHSGSYAARLGSTSPTSGDSSVAQTFTVPSGYGALSFWYKAVCPDTVTYDWATATLKDNTAGTTATVLARTCTNNGTWQQVTAAVTAGHSYTLTLVSHDDNYTGDATYTLYDDVALGAAAPPPPAGITNGGFETGSFTGWTRSGAASTLITSAHSGSYAARLGSTSPTNGDSSVSQTFTAPSGTTALSLWYRMTCPDTVTYDWATATLKDNTAGTTTTVLAKTCATGGWVSRTASIVAGHSYTLTFTSHDDNYSGDATYTDLDDVTVQ